MKKVVLALLLIFTLAGAPAKARVVAVDASVGVPATPIAGAVHGSWRTLTAQTPDAVARRKANLVGHHRSTAMLTLDIGLGVRDSATLDAIIAAASDPHSLDYGHYLSNADYMARFAPTPDQVQAVRDWARSAGLTVRGVSPDNLLVTVSGATSQVEQAFSVTLNDYSRSGRTFMSNDRDPVVPSDLPIQAVDGLNTVHVFHAQVARMNAMRAGGYYPGDFRTAYDMNAVGDGSGQTIGFTLWGTSIAQSDLNTFASQTGTPAITSGQAGANGIDWIPVNGGSADTNELMETAMDVEYAHGVAPNSHLKYWLADCTYANGSCNPSDVGLEEAISAAANDTSLHVVSNSWGGGEAASANDPFVANVNASLQHAAAVGTTFYFSSGDSGSNSGGTGLPSFPADSPYVVSVGGTSLTAGSSYSYGSESAWSGSGGGCSNVFARPSWQVSVSAATCSGRAEPDVSADADPNTGAYVYVAGGGYLVGGTSLAAPLWAGMAAITNHYLGSNGAALMGFAAPELYHLATNGATAARDFHDVTSGNDGYPAGAGWDQATGWGSPDLSNLVADWAGNPLPTSTPTPAPLVATANYSFEAPALGTGSNAYQYNPSGGSWTFTGSTGVAANGSAFFVGDPNAPDGTQAAFIQKVGSLQQAIGSFQAGVNYAVSFQAIQRAGQSEDFAVYLDNALLGTFQPAGGSYSTYTTATFPATAGTHTLTFTGLDSAGGDNTAFIDAVRIVAGTGPTITPLPTNTPTATPTSTPTNTPTAAPTSTPLVPLGNVSFEAPALGTGSNAYQYNPTGAGWTFSGSTGIAADGSAFFVGDPNAPDGTQAAFIQKVGSLQQAIGSFQAGVNYAFSFQAIQRAGQNEDFSVSLDGTPLGMFRPSGGSYTTYTTGTFQTTAGTHTLTFTGLDSAGGDNTAFIDAVRIVPGTGPTITPMPTSTPTNAPTNTPTSTPTNVPTNTPTSTPTNAATATPLVGTANSSFEAPALGTGSNAYQYNPTGAGWTFSGSTGIAADGSAFFAGDPNAPDGTQAAFIQKVGSFQQAISSFQAGVNYAISFQAIQRAGQSQDFAVYLDSVPLGTFRPSGGSYTTYTTGTFQTTAGTHTLKFAGLNSAGGDNTAFVDTVNLVAGTGPTMTPIPTATSTPTATPTATATATPLVTPANSGFEAPALGTGSNAYQYNPSGGSWTFTGSTGVAANGSAFFVGDPNAPDGTQAAFIQKVGSLQQAIGPFQTGVNYAISFQAIQRAGQSQDFSVALDGTPLGTFRPSGGAYGTYTTATFQTTAGTHTLTFTGLDSAGGDNTAFVDAVQVIVGTGTPVTPTPTP